MSTQSQVRVRFAPSPTGALHIGGVRTALFNWLYARHFDGQFLLRIEDTDTERSEESHTKDILAVMHWLGMDSDEPVLFQSKRWDLYQKRAQELVDQGHGYRCYCTPDELEQMRQKAMAEGKKPMYDRRCRNLTEHPEGKPFVIRAKIPLEGQVEFNDLIHGKITISNSEIDDFVMIGSNGVPTYHLVVVIDDAEMKISHVIRGDDHINNTPRQVHLYRFLGEKLPEFAHLSMILGTDKKKLSKRHGDVSANVYRGEGILPQALLNFLVRLGWSHGDQEIFTIDEMIQFFNFDSVTKSAAVFNPEKLEWLNGNHIRQSSASDLAEKVLEDFGDYFSSEATHRLQTPFGLRLVELVQQKVKTLKEMAQMLVPLCTPGAVEVDTSSFKWNKKPEIKSPILAVVRTLVDDWDSKIKSQISSDRTLSDMAWGGAPRLMDLGIKTEEVHETLKDLSKRHGVKLGDLTQPMRICMTGREVSVGMFDLLVEYPWDLVFSRLSKVLEYGENS
ncbi:MAG: glutamate--tRNA ligase [Bdellovibrionaceae bacterium]|nr:glutamate--tRNA ligase [Pseudobdellovibrionaceae bacterium]